jgi:hypothetical protein
MRYAPLSASVRAICSSESFTGINLDTNRIIAKANLVASSVLSSNAFRPAGGFVASRLSLCRSPKLLKPKRVPLPIGIILGSSRQLDQCTGHRFEPEFEEGAAVQFEPPERRIRKSGSIPIRLASKAAWLIFERGIHSLRPAGPIARRHPSRCGRHRGVAVGVAEDFTTPLTSYP